MGLSSYTRTSRKLVRTHDVGTKPYLRKESEPTCGWMVRGTVVSPAHQGSNPGARIYFWSYFRISGDAHSVGGDVLVDDDAPKMICCLSLLNVPIRVECACVHL